MKRNTRISMTPIAKWYKAETISLLKEKYHLSERDAKEAVKVSGLEHCLVHLPEVTVHDDIDENTKDVYKKYCKKKSIRH